MPSLGSGGAEKSFISLLELLPRDVFDINVMVVNQGGMFYSHIPKDVTMIEAPKRLRIALGSIHSQFMHQECNLWERLLKLASNIAVRFHGMTNLDLLQFTWTLWCHSIPMVNGEWDVAVSFMNGMTNYFVIDKIKARRKILWVHNDYKMFKSNHKFDSRYWVKADKVVTISNVCVNSLEECFPHIRGKFTYIENISSAKTIHSMANETYPVEYQKTDKDVIKLLSIGRLAEQKGFDMAINAAAMLKEKSIAFRWFIIGGGGLKNDLQARINNQKLTDCVILLGERANPYTYMSHADIIVQTSRYEGKSIVIDEAKILHKPIIITNYPSAHDNINDGVTGIICPMNANGIAEAIEKLASHKAIQNQLSENLARMHHSNEKEIEKYSLLFNCKS